MERLERDVKQPDRVNISVTKKQSQFLDKLMAKGKYASKAAFMRSLLDRYITIATEHERLKRRILREKGLILEEPRILDDQKWT